MTNAELHALYRRHASAETYQLATGNQSNESMRGTTVNLKGLFKHEFRPETVQVMRHGRFSITPAHTHEHFEIMYVYSGSITHHVGDARITLLPGDMIALTPGTFHSTEICGEDDIAVNLILTKEFFTPSFMSRITSGRRVFSFFADGLMEHRNNLDDFLYLRTDSAVFDSLFDTIACEFYDPDIFSEDIILNLISTLFTAMSRVILYDPSDSAKQTFTTELDFRKLLRYIETNYKSATLKSAAERFGYSPNYLSALIKKQYGSGFTNIRLRYCIAQAELLLAHTSLPISEVAAQSGFSNITYFYKLFTRHNGITPAEYRAKLLNNKSTSA